MFDLYYYFIHSRYFVRDMERKIVTNQRRGKCRRTENDVSYVR